MMIQIWTRIYERYEEGERRGGEGGSHKMVTSRQQCAQQFLMSTAIPELKRIHKLILCASIIFFCITEAIDC